MLVLIVINLLLITRKEIFCCMFKDACNPKWRFKVIVVIIITKGLHFANLSIFVAVATGLRDTSFLLHSLMSNIFCPLSFEKSTYFVSAIMYST